MSHIVDISGKFGPELDKTVAAMKQKGKGLLAADESTGTIQKRFDAIGVENTEEHRRAYRDLLFSVSKEASQYISGVILYEETLFQKGADGIDFAKKLTDHGIVPGIKLDLGVVELPGFGGEVITNGFDGLEKRIQKYYAQGARFAKWRAVINVNPAKGQPSQPAIELNAQYLARYAAICQANGLVPIVEPEVLVMEGDHGIAVSYDATQRTLAAVFKALLDQHVQLERIILKPNMVLPGDKCPTKAECDKHVAELTLKVLQRCVPPAVQAIMFLSGGQSEQQAADNLDALNKLPGAKPWELSFSYGRALQKSALSAWKGKPENVAAAQKAYLEKSKNCYLATLGKLK